MDKRKTAKKLSVSFKYSNKIKKYVNGDTIDELIDGLELLNDGSFINDFVAIQQLTQEQLERLDKIILSCKEAEEICEYAIYRKEVSNLSEFEDTLISLDAPYQICELAKLKGASIEKLQNAVIESKNTDAMVRFYKEIESADAEKTKKALFEQKAASDIFFFFWKKIEREKIIIMSEIFEAENIIIESKNAQTMRFWLEFIRYSTKMEDALIECNEVLQLYELAKGLKNGNSISKLEDAVIASGNAEVIYRFAKYIEGSNKKKLRKAIMKTKDQHWIREWKADFGTKGLLFFQK